MDRRTTIKWMLAAGAAPSIICRRPVRADSAAPKGYGSDPDLLKIYEPGEVWPLTLTSGERRTAAALSDVILPADAHSPSASSVGVVDFIDEWISAPYPDQRRDRPVVLEGLAWIDSEGQRRFAKSFADLSTSQQHDICDTISDEARVDPALQTQARFFALYRDLTAGGFYSTPVGRKDLQFVGNVPLARFEGPPQDLLRKLGLDDDIINPAKR
jgi:hypothetical protein